MAASQKIDEVDNWKLGVGDRRIAALLGVCLSLFYLLFSHGHFAGSDEQGVFDQTRSLYTQGSLAVPKGWHRYKGADGRIYSHFAIGQSIAALPLYTMGAFAAKTLPPSWLQAVDGRRNKGRRYDARGGPEVFAVSLYGPLASGLLVALFYLFERRLGVSVRSAVAASALLGSTTYLATMSMYFLRHTTEALSILAGLYFLFLWKRSGRLRWLALGSGVASLTLLIRFPAAIAAPALIGYMLWQFRGHTAENGRPSRALIAAAVPVIAVLLAHSMVNHLKWGTWLTSPMLAQSAFFGTPLLVGLRGFLLSPGCSIFVYSPLLLLAPRTVPIFWRVHRAECVTVFAIVLTFLLVCSTFDAWTGLWASPGPRYLFVATPLLMLPMGLWLDTKPHGWEKIAIAVLALGGLVVQIPLMAARFGGVIAAIGSQASEPGKDFVFQLELSPALLSARLVASGDIDAWIWRLWRGWPGVDGQPLLAAVLLACWAVVAGVCVTALCRSVRASDTS